MSEVLTFEEAIEAVAKEIAELVISKQHDYGHGNILAFGEYGTLVRSSDKLERLKNLAKKGGIALHIEADYTCPECGQTHTFEFGSDEVNAALNEPVEDTWKDLAGYAYLALLLRRGLFTLPLEKDLKR